MRALFLLGALVLAGGAAPAQAGGGFVSARDGRFYLDGEPFRFAGANNYYLVYKSEGMTEDVFASAAAMGLRVIRTWGFLDGRSHDGVVLQPELGKFDEAGLRRMDRVIEQAARHGLKLVIALVNRWDDFGGMRWYVEQTGGGNVDEFYTRPEAKEAYQAWVSQVLNRVNTRTGIAYKDDPAIFAWQLANEPRCPSDPSGETLVEWAGEMSAFIKSIDPHHMVSTGDEGFYRNPGDRDWTRNGKEGVDWQRLLALPDIDYGTVHLYPEHWDQTPEWGTGWIREHVRDARKIGKPVVIEEFGLKDQSRRDAVYGAWLAAAEEESAGGTMVWLLTGKQDDGTPYPDYDGFDVKFPGPTAEVIARHARRMSGKKDSGFLSTKGRSIVDAAGRPFRVAGVSWFGSETDTMVVHGLWQRNYREMAAQIRSLGFNMPHDYPASVYRQAWFEAPNYPENLPAVWDRFWGFIPRKLDVPVLLGEFGGKLETDSDRAWLRALTTYLRGREIGWIWWSWNPNSGDTGGILRDDWVTVDETKMGFLREVLSQSPSTE